MHKEAVQYSLFFIPMKTEPLTSHLSHLTSHLSHLTSHLSPFIFTSHCSFPLSFSTVNCISYQLITISTFHFSHLTFHPLLSIIQYQLSTIHYPFSIVHSPLFPPSIHIILPYVSFLCFKCSFFLVLNFLSPLQNQNALAL